MITSAATHFNVIEPIMQAFLPEVTIASIKAYGQGHINKSYKVTCNHGATAFLLQQINTHVFQDINGLMSNISIICDHLNQSVKDNKPPFKKALTLIRTPSKATYHQDKTNCVWRLYEYIPQSKCYQTITNLKHARQAGEAFGAFFQQVSKIDPLLLTKTIEGFHDLTHVLQKFNEVRVTRVDRASQCQSLIDFILQHKDQMMALDKLRKDNKLPIRITHNDTKFNNVLFNEADELLCVVDYDTVMPGLIHHDYGDALRIIANTAKEDEKDLAKVSFDLSRFTAFTGGFLSQAKHSLTDVELQTLPLALPLMPFMLGIRFLTDYLEDNPYFAVDYHNHNQVRARAQFALVVDILKNEAKIQTHYHDCLKGLSLKINRTRLPQS